MALKSEQLSGFEFWYSCDDEWIGGLRPRIDRGKHEIGSHFRQDKKRLLRVKDYPGQIMANIQTGVGARCLERDDFAF